MNSSKQSLCNLPIPSAILLQQEQLPPNFFSGEITIEGRLTMRQVAAFHCPFFLRRIKSNFYHSSVPENSTDINDYKLEVIQRKLVNNPGYMLFEKTNTFWSRQQQNKVIVNIVLNIGETMNLYHTTFWQKLGKIWIQYLSIFVVFYYAMDMLKYYMFTRQKIRAWELVPWKKFY